jgi:ferredoxin
LSKEEALAAFREHEREGLCHTVWTFVAPFIGGICNCDRSDCMAMKATVTHQFPVMFRAEYVAAVSPGLCNGCRQCMRVCQFGAIGYSAANESGDRPRRYWLRNLPRRASRTRSPWRPGRPSRPPLTCGDMFPE